MTRVLILAALFLVLAPAAWADGFVPGTEDVPLMPGLAAESGPDIVFDKPQGRIIATKAHGTVSRAAVIAFYRDSLPQLGWHPADERHFERDGERLSLDFAGTDGNLRVDFTLTPH